MSKKFSIGEKVYVEFAGKKCLGCVEEYCDDCPYPYYTVSLDYEGEVYTMLYYTEEYMEESGIYNVNIEKHGNTTVSLAKNYNGKVKHRGVAKLSKEDKYNEDIGMLVSFLRLLKNKKSDEMGISCAYRENFVHDYVMNTVFESLKYV